MEDLNRIEIKRKNKKFSLILPIPPSVNKIHYTDRKGVRRLTSESEKYIRDVRALTRMKAEEQGWEKTNDATWYYLDLMFYFPDKRIRDSHNCLKILLDALESVLFHNDYFILPRIQVVELDKANPRLELCLHPQTVSERSNLLQTI